MRTGQRLVGILWRWHRRVGLALFVFILLLTSTGVLLNHSSELGLDRRFVVWDWLGELYGDTPIDIRSYSLAGGENPRWLTRIESGRVYVDGQEVGVCRGSLLGAFDQEELIVAVCAQEILLLTPGGELVESITVSTGLPVPLLAAGLSNNNLVIQTALGWVLADFDTLDFTAPIAAGATLSQQTPGQLPAELRSAIPTSERWLTWERVLLDLHSGRLAGNLGVYSMDLVALLLAAVASGGVVMWVLRRRRR